MRKRDLLLIVVFFCVGFFGFKLGMQFVKNNHDPKSSVAIQETITHISQDAGKGFVFTAASGDKYYINNDKPRQLNLDSLNAKVLNKTVTLQVYKFWLGTSENISQLEVNDNIIFTEFN